MPFCFNTVISALFLILLSVSTLGASTLPQDLLIIALQRETQDNNSISNLYYFQEFLINSSMPNHGQYTSLFPHINQQPGLINLWAPTINQINYLFAIIDMNESSLTSCSLAQLEKYNSSGSIETKQLQPEQKRQYYLNITLYKDSSIIDEVSKLPPQFTLEQINWFGFKNEIVKQITLYSIEDGLSAQTINLIKDSLQIKNNYNQQMVSQKQQKASHLKVERERIAEANQRTGRNLFSYIEKNNSNSSISNGDSNENYFTLELIQHLIQIPILIMVILSMLAGLGGYFYQLIDHLQLFYFFSFRYVATTPENLNVFFKGIGIFNFSFLKGLYCIIAKDEQGVCKHVEVVGDAESDEIVFISYYINYLLTPCFVILFMLVLFLIQRFNVLPMAQKVDALLKSKIIWKLCTDLCWFSSLNVTVFAVYQITTVNSSHAGSVVCTVFGTLILACYIVFFSFVFYRYRVIQADQLEFIEEDFLQSFRGLWNNLKQDRKLQMYYKFILLLRRGFGGLILGLLYNDPNTQLLLLVFMNLFYLILAIFVEPMRTRAEQILNKSGELILFVTNIMLLAMQNEEDIDYRINAGWGVIVLMMILLVYYLVVDVVYFIAKQMHAYQQEKSSESQIHGFHIKVQPIQQITQGQGKKTKKQQSLPSQPTIATAIVTTEYNNNNDKRETEQSIIDNKFDSMFQKLEQQRKSFRQSILKKRQSQIMLQPDQQQQKYKRRATKKNTHDIEPNVNEINSMMKNKFIGSMTQIRDPIQIVSTTNINNGSNNLIASQQMLSPEKYQRKANYKKLTKDSTIRSTQISDAFNGGSSVQNQNASQNDESLPPQLRRASQLFK